MERGGTFDEGLAAARAMGITEADGAYDVEGWDSAAKAAALANVLMDARTTPQAVNVRGITRLTPERVREIAREGKTVRLVSRGKRSGGEVSLRGGMVDIGETSASSFCSCMHWSNIVCKPKRL